MGPDIERLCRRLEYQFEDKNLLRAALTHRSMGNNNNERLEFLGDSILNFSMAEIIYYQFPRACEGELSRLRSFLVKGDTLAEIAREINLGDHLFLGQGELKSGGFRRASILADSLEAIFAAIFIDKGIESTQKVIRHLYASRLDAAQLPKNLKDSKTQLQEYLQANRCALPVYELQEVAGSQHEQEFFVICRVKNYTIEAVGKGSSRRKAEQEAAKLYLNLVRERSSKYTRDPS